MNARLRALWLPHQIWRGDFWGEGTCHVRLEDDQLQLTTTLNGGVQPRLGPRLINQLWNPFPVVLHCVRRKNRQTFHRSGVIIRYKPAERALQWSARFFGSSSSRVDRSFMKHLGINWSRCFSYALAFLFFTLNHTRSRKIRLMKLCQFV